MALGLTPIATALTAYNGASLYHVTEPVKTLAGAVVDLSSGYAAVLTIRPRYLRRVILTLTQGAGLTLGADGTITIDATVLQVAAFDADDFPARYSLVITNAGDSSADMVLDGIVGYAPGEVA